MLKFTIPELPKSMNAIYRIVPYWSQRRISVELKDDVRLWKQKAKEYIPPWTDKPPEGQIPLIWMSLSFHGTWHTSKGKVRVIDLPNLVKVTVDTIAEKLGFNDSMIFEMRSILKVVDAKEQVEVELGYL